MAGGKGAPSWLVEISLCEQFHWTERQLREENTVGFVRRIGLFNELSQKAQKSKGSYEPAKAKVSVRGRQV